MGPEDLAHVLRPFAEALPADLLVGLHTADDAAVYKLNPEQALVQTVDFFPPIVDDAYTYGAIAAANSLSDVYAMGGKPLLALNIAAWPDNLPLDLLAEVFRGGREKALEAGAVIAGGHTVKDDEPKYGLSVTGIVPPDQVTTKGGARPGDKLVLTKPLGTGAVTTALRASRAEPADVRAAVDSMTRLNRDAAELAREARATAVTDITGFGLFGHAYEMASASGVELRLSLSSLPILPGALRYIEQGIVPGGTGRNKDYLLAAVDGRARVRWDDAADQALLTLGLDPQTSGGLLMAVPPEALSGLTEHAVRLNQPVWVIGEAAEGTGVQVLP